MIRVPSPGSGTGHQRLFCYYHDCYSSCSNVVFVFLFFCYFFSVQVVFYIFAEGQKLFVAWPFAPFSDDTLLSTTSSITIQQYIAARVLDYNTTRVLDYNTAQYNTTQPIILYHVIILCYNMLCYIVTC